LANQARVSKPQLEQDALEALAQYDFPGNVRELENVLERAIALCDGVKVTREDLQLTPPEVAEVQRDASSDGKWPLQEYLDRVEREAILEALEKTRFNRTAAAKLLGITFRAMRYRMERLGIN
jgi:two-component system response regulator PilR (NtrC family)